MEYGCTTCGTTLAESGIEREGASGTFVYAKFDLTREALAAFPELASAVRKEGAIRASVVARTAAPATLALSRGVALKPGAEYVAIKAPTIEGTEIWIVAARRQEEFERAAGFGKTSQPLLAFPAERLQGKQVKDPVEGGLSPIALDERVTLGPGTGVAYLPDSREARSLDSDDSVIARLRNEGLLAAQEEGRFDRARCRRCGSRCVEGIIG